MKRNFFGYLLLVLLMAGTASCKKQIEQAKENAVVDIMVSKKWIVLQFLEGTNDVSAEFNGYDFQFYRDNTVIGANATASKTGSWSGDAATTSITANFSNSSNPLARLNGKWIMYTYDSQGPKFNQIINGVEMKLILREK